MSKKNPEVSFSSKIESIDAKDSLRKRALYERLYVWINTQRFKPDKAYAISAFWQMLALEDINLDKMLSLLSEVPGVQIDLSDRSDRRENPSYIIIFDAEKTLGFLKKQGVAPLTKVNLVNKTQGGLVGWSSVSQFDQFLPNKE